MDLRSTYLDLAQEALDLVATPEVAAAWHRPSALADMSTASLVGHLLRGATITVEQYLDAEPPQAGATLVDPPHYYASVPADASDPIHRAVIERSEAAAAAGHDASLQSARQALARLSDRLAQEPAERTVAVLNGTPMLLDDYLLTRIVEIVLHREDLALSAGLAVPTTQPEALAAVAHLSVDIARARHGDAPVVRAFFRRERQTIDILRTF